MALPIHGEHAECRLKMQLGGRLTDISGPVHHPCRCGPVPVPIHVALPQAHRARKPASREGLVHLGVIEMGPGRGDGPQSILRKARLRRHPKRRYSPFPFFAFFTLSPWALVHLVVGFQPDILVLTKPC